MRGNMDNNIGFSLLHPVGTDSGYRRLPDNVLHDLGLEEFCKAISGDAKERRLITNVLSQITDDVNVAAYRRQVFRDILRLPELRKTLLELFDKLQFMQDFSTIRPLMRSLDCGISFTVLMSLTAISEL